MRNKNLKVLVIGAILISTILSLTGCGKETNKEIEKKVEVTDIKGTINNLNEDVKITGMELGGDTYIEYVYYIKYDGNKLYTYDARTKVPIVDAQDKITPDATEEMYEYTLTENKINELKEFIESQGKSLDGGKYIVKTDNKTYGIEDSEKFEEIIKSITENI